MFVPTFNKKSLGLYKHFIHHSSYVCNWFIPHLQMYSASCLLTSQSVLVIKFILERNLIWRFQFCHWNKQKKNASPHYTVSLQTTKHKKKHYIWCCKSRSWVGTGKKCIKIKPINEIPTLPFLIIRSLKTIQI